MTQPETLPTSLPMGQERHVCVCARDRWNRTFVQVGPGEQYRLDVIPPDQIWTDWWEPSTAAGFSRPRLRVFERWRRVPDANWFALIGSVGQTLAGAFLIGTGASVTVATAGELHCFANDISWMYWNNKGSLVLTIRRLA
ncbi:hypothetical protein FBQ97_02315 [Acidobacteria bacterium ACD]|nr:hypothetical protein [Acidobacteria bacterium ACB2]MDL1948635.1 hypothetical protein [Acidobacteria bacterium ACD]